MLEIRFIGVFEVRRDGESIEIHSRLSQSLLAYLALNARKRFRREQLAGFFWPDSDETKARRRLRQTLWRLRNLIGREFFLADRVSIGFNPDASYILDVDVLEDDQAWVQPSDDLVKNISYYTGDLLPGFYEEWVDLERQRLKAIFERNMRVLLNCLLEDHRWLDVLRCGECWIAQGEAPEPAYRALMIAHHELGDASGASEVFHRCVRFLRDDIGVDPSPETKILYQRLQTDEESLEVPPRDSQYYLYQPLTSFIGREKDLTQVCEKLADPSCRLLTLIGPGGIGKTRLALQVAHESLKDYAHGVYFIPLEHISSSELTTLKIANTLGFEFSEGDEPKLQLENYLRQKEILMVVDNLEHIITGATVLVDILEAAPRVMILTTSRERLNLTGEWVFEVSGMIFPDQEEVDYLEKYSAIKLFIDRARRVSSDFTPTKEDLRFIVRICRLVEGAPLAIELSSACVRGFSCEEIAREIEASIDFLAEAPRDGPERQMSLRASFIHSWKLLSDQHRAVMRKLAIFQGGFQKEAAKYVAEATPSILMSLDDKSLIRRNISGRYEIHPLIKQFVEEELLKSIDEWHMTRELYCRYFVDLANEQAEGLRGAGQDEALEKIGDEIDNIRASLQWAVEQCAVEMLGMLLDVLRVFYDVRGWYSEGDSVFGQVVGCLGGTNSTFGESDTDSAVLCAKALAGQAWFCHRLYHREKACALLQRSLSVSCKFGLREIEGDCMDSLAVIALREGNYQNANDLFLRCLAIWKELGNSWWQATDLICLSHVARSKGHFQEAKQYSAEGLARFKELGSPWGIASALCAKGASARELKDYEEAQRCYRESKITSNNIGWRGGIARASLGLGRVAYLLGKYDDAMVQCKLSLEIFTELGKKVEIPTVLSFLGAILRAKGEFQASESNLWHALEVALDIESAPEILRAFTGLAPIILREGDEDNTVQLLRFIIAHSATKSIDRDNAKKLLSDLISGRPHYATTAELEDLEGMEISEIAKLVLRSHP